MRFTFTSANLHSKTGAGAPKNFERLAVLVLCLLDNPGYLVLLWLYSPIWICDGSITSIVGSDRLERESLDGANGEIQVGCFFDCGRLLDQYFIFPCCSQGLFGSARVPLLTPTRASIVERDHLLGTRISEIAKTFDPNTTVVIAGGFFIRTADYYLRDFQETDLSYRLPVDPNPLPDQVDTLVFLDPLVFSDLSSEKLESFILSDGSSLRYIRWNKNEQLWVSQAGIEMKER